MLIINAQELVQSRDGRWHRIHTHHFQYAKALNINGTYCGLTLTNPPYKAFNFLPDGGGRPTAEDWFKDRCIECEVKFAGALEAAAADIRRQAILLADG